jgi:hypothetical protein
VCLRSAVVIIGASLSIGTRVRLSTWWRDGWKWVAVCDAGVVMAVALWAFATEESGGRWRPTCHRTGCGESYVGRPDQLPASHKDQLQLVVSVDEDQARGAWTLDCN